MSYAINTPGGIQNESVPHKNLWHNGVIPFLIPKIYWNHRRQHEAQQYFHRQEIPVKADNIACSYLEITMSILECGANNTFGVIPRKCIQSHKYRNMKSTYLSPKATTGSEVMSSILICRPLEWTSGCLRIINQPTCEKKKPRLLLCGSASVSENLWWTRWSLTQLYIEFCKNNEWKNTFRLHLITSSKLYTVDHNLLYHASWVIAT